MSGVQHLGRIDNQRFEWREFTKCLAFYRKRTGASGILLLKPGQSYEVAKITGVVYSLSITPKETPPAPKPEPGAKPSADAATDPQQADESTRPENGKPNAAERNGPSDEDRKRYESLSDGAKEKFREALREVFSNEEFRHSPEAERRAKIRTLFDKGKAEDQAREK